MDKDVLDFRINKGSCIRNLRSRVNQDWVVNRGTISTPVAISDSIFDKPWILWKIAETHKKFHYSHDRRKHQSLWLLVQSRFNQDYKNNTDLLYNSHEMQIHQLLQGQSSLQFSQRTFILMTILSYLLVF